MSPQSSPQQLDDPLANIGIVPSTALANEVRIRRASCHQRLHHACLELVLVADYDLRASRLQISAIAHELDVCKTRSLRAPRDALDGVLGWAALPLPKSYRALPTASKKANGGFIQVDPQQHEPRGHMARGAIPPLP